MIHELKTWPEYFEKVKSGEKRFELRKDDRDYNEGDFLLLREYKNELEGYTGRSFSVQVIYILRNAERFGLMNGYCLMSIR